MFINWYWWHVCIFIYSYVGNMMDPIREVYKILIRHLGEKTPRGGLRIPEQYEELHKELSRIVSYAIAIGKNKHSIEILKKLQQDMQIYLGELTHDHIKLTQATQNIKPKSDEEGE